MRFIFRKTTEINNNAKDGFKISPDSIDDITPEWMEWALKTNETIGKNVNISNVVVTKLSTEAGGEGRGGMTDAQLLRIALEYDELSDTTGNEPKAVVTKVIFRISMFQKLSLKNRIILKMLAGAFGNKTEEEFWRTEARFYQEAVPLIEGDFLYPKVYYTGMSEVNDRSKFSSVILNTQPHLRTIVMVQDMKGWKSETILSNILAGGLSRDYAENMLKNIAILHASFWGEKMEKLSHIFKNPAKTEIFDCRQATHSKYFAWKRNRFLSNVNNCKKKIYTLLEQWSDHEWMRIHKDVKPPHWITIEPLEDGSIPILKDPMVLEMLNVLANRYPKFNIDVANDYLNKPMQTIIHGDFHAGNHMYGLDKNQGKVVAVDFQMVGFGRVVSDLAHSFVNQMAAFITIDELMELMKIYHSSLVQNGVMDYPWEEFKQDLVVGSLECGLKNVIEFWDRSPEKWAQLIKVFGDKTEDINVWMEHGLMTFPIRFMTSLYHHDKENFLCADKFLLNL